MDKVYNTESAKTDLFSSITRDNHGGKETKNSCEEEEEKEKETEEVVVVFVYPRFKQSINLTFLFLSSAVFSISRRSIDRSIDRVALNVLA